MKKFKAEIFAVFVGILCSFFLFNTFFKGKKINGKHNAVAVQIGVFTKKENAISMQESFGGMVHEEGGIYRVYYSILNNDENIEYITNYLEKEGINYYLKDINVDEDFLYKSKSYEVLMSRSIKSEAKLTINGEILKLYGEVI